MKKDIVFFGMQWSGKWTQADLFLEKFPSYQYFEPGNILRALKSNDNVLWAHIRESMKEWKMVDDAVVFGLFDIYMHLLEKDQNMLIDGFLRTENQLHYFLSKSYLKKRDCIAIYYDIPRELAVERLLARAKKEWREDDNIESIETRLDIYQKETMPVIDYFRQKWRLIEIDGRGKIKEVFEQTIKVLGERWYL